MLIAATLLILAWIVVAGLCAVKHAEERRR